MAKEHTIEIEGLPEGWEAVAYMIPREGVDYVLTGTGVELCDWDSINPWLVVRKTQPRRIVAPDGILDPTGLWVTKDGAWILREVKEE